MKRIAKCILLLACAVAPAFAQKAAPSPVFAYEQLKQLAGKDSFKPFDGNPVLRPGTKSEWDAGALGTMNVLKVGNTFHMYYEAWGVRSSVANNWSDFTSLQIGHATSTDGIHWTKDPANPVLPKGGTNDWDRDGTWDPFVLYENGVFKMWYGGGQKKCDWGYAVSTDGVHFVKNGQISHIGQVEDDYVVHDPVSGHYFMYYRDRVHAPNGLPYCAESTNETNFNFDKAQMIQVVGLPSRTSYKFPRVFQEDGRWFLFFCKYAGPNCKGCWTGYATSQDRLHWQVQNPQFFFGHDAYVVKVADDFHFLYYGPDGYYDQKDCDIRVALFKGKLK